MIIYTLAANFVCCSLLAHVSCVSTLKCIDGLIFYFHLILASLWCVIINGLQLNGISFKMINLH